MTTFLKGLALLVATCCVVWIAVLWRWQSTQREMSVEDVALYLGALPLTLFALLALGVWAGRGALAKANSAAQASAQPAPADGASPTAANADDAARHTTWQLLAAHGRSVLGASAQEWFDAIQAQAPAPTLDPQLHDVQGMPVFSARVAELDVSAVAEEIEPALKSLQTQNPQLQAPEHLLRALALLRDPLREAVAALAPWADRFTKTSTASKAPPARIGVLAAWPSGLSAPELELAQRWLLDRCRQASAAIAAPECWAVVPVPPLPAGKANTPISGPQLWMQADAWFEVQRREQTADPLLLLAAHSDVSASCIGRLEADTAVGLLSSQRPKGLVPGEASAALLLAPADWPAAPDATEPVPRLHRAVAAPRDKSVDASGRVTHTIAATVLAHAATAAQCPLNTVGALVNDANQHTARGAELSATLADHLPQLDVNEEVYTFGQLCGNVGPCATLMTVAMAAFQALKTDKPCAALSLQDPHWRAALIARPAPPAPPATNPATDARPTAATDPAAQPARPT